MNLHDYGLHLHLVNYSAEYVCKWAGKLSMIPEASRTYSLKILDHYSKTNYRGLVGGLYLNNMRMATAYVYRHPHMITVDCVPELVFLGAHKAEVKQNAQRFHQQMQKFQKANRNASYKIRIKYKASYIDWYEKRLKK